MNSKENKYSENNEQNENGKTKEEENEKTKEEETKNISIVEKDKKEENNELSKIQEKDKKEENKELSNIDKKDKNEEEIQKNNKLSKNEEKNKNEEEIQKNNKLSKNEEKNKNEEKIIEKESKENKPVEDKEKNIINSEQEKSEIINNKNNNIEKLKDFSLNLDAQKEQKSSFFALNKKRLLELNLTKSKSSQSSGEMKSKKNSFKSKKKSESNEEYNEYEDDYLNDDINEDDLEEQQNDVLETMFIEAKNTEEDQSNKIDLFLDIISLDETKEKVWTYKCYEQICLIKIKKDDHDEFLVYYDKLRDIAHKLDEKKVSIYIKFTAEEFIKEIVKKTKVSINHWLEDISKDFNIFQKDKIINEFEAKINLNFLLIVNKIKKEEKYDSEDENKFDINVIEYMQDKQHLEELTNTYLIEECKCDPKFLDSKGNTFFYFCPKDSKRGGELYNVPVGWTAFGIEVLNRYGNDDWLSSDGKEGEWAVAYHGFGRAMDSPQLKELIKTIIHDNLRPGRGQACHSSFDARHKGNICGSGVYITPNINIAQSYAGFIQLGNKTYNIVIMVRVNPKFIRQPEIEPEYWIVDGKAEQLRPYRLLIKECSMINRYY